MAENNKFQEFMNSLLNIKSIAIIAVAGAIFAASVSFLKTAKEGYNLIYKEPDTALIPEPEFKFNDTLTIKGTVDIFTLIKNLAVDNTVEDEQEVGITSDWHTEADNPHITWVAEAIDWSQDGLTEGDDSNLFFGRCNQSRTGYCILTDNGKPLYTDLGIRTEPGVWSVTYCNSILDGDRIIISSEVAGEGLGLKIVSTIFEGKAKLTLIKSIEPKFDDLVEDNPAEIEHPQGDHFWTYIVEIPKKKKMKITEYGYMHAHGGRVVLKLE